MTGNTYRNPALLAKTITALDHVSGGRATLGIGAGWFELEHQSLGFEFGTFTDRFASKNSEHIFGDDIAAGAVLADKKCDNPVCYFAHHKSYRLDQPGKEFDELALEAGKGNIVTDGQNLGGNFTQ